MHELSLAQALLEQVLEVAAAHGDARVRRVRVLVGPFSGVVRDSLAFGFDFLKAGHPRTEGARLEFEAPDPVWQCPACGGETRGEESASPWTARCPACGAAGLAPRGGGELVLQEVELE